MRYLTIKIGQDGGQYYGTVPRIKTVVAQARTIETVRVQLRTMIDQWFPEYAGVPFREVYDPAADMTGVLVLGEQDRLMPNLDAAQRSQFCDTCKALLTVIGGGDPHEGWCRQLTALAMRVEDLERARRNERTD